MRSIKDCLYSFMVHTSSLYSDVFYIRRQFFYHLHYLPNLVAPKTYQEKVQWLKLNDRKPQYSYMVDKYEAKSFISKKVGEQFVVPTIGVFDRASDINYSLLPDTFVMKTTHDSGTVIICRDKSKIDVAKTNRFLEKRLHRNYWLIEREWPYKNVRPRIIVEQLLGRPDEDLYDYKWYCFDGEPKLMFTISCRNSKEGHKADFYDMDGNRMDIWQPGYENNECPPPLPPCFEQMKELARILSAGISHLRVDFYFTNNQIYVGELTFSDGGGYLNFIPEEWNYILGEWIKLPIDE